MNKKIFSVYSTESPARGLSFNGGFCLLNADDNVIQDGHGFRSKNRNLPPYVFDVLQVLVWIARSGWVPSQNYVRSLVQVEEVS